MLEINLEFRKGIFFVRLKGKLTTDTVYKLKEEVTKRILKSGIRNVVFNIEELEEIDLKGISSLLYNYEICNKNNGKSLLCGIKNYKIKLKLEQSRLLKYINETENELSAFKIMNV